jgi:UDP-N-acetylmuramyl tripeptide synthase
VSVTSKIVTTCAGHITEMEGYGLTQQMLDAVDPQLSEYAAALPGTKRAIASRKTATGGLVAAFATADSLIKKIDAMMELVSTDDPPFYQEYKNLRVIDDLKGKAKHTGNGSMGITGTASSIETGLNQPGVKVSIAGTNLSTLTDAEGNYTLAVSDAGTYSLLATLSGYADYTEDDIEVNPGELTEVDFDMEPAT